ncbi:hypothetical protein HELRODRAFT_183703 [Helobdella robusta]|uniref:Uncharacterized protein n=1 Tax=Helobdella robusta TaxID=6412 RepID=T1FK28_HELRO|nr:hypothetical protein HELRODRAFT_183703 [Helobdella robusta]ESO10378.1 hypothetical protein HELRODRAFT_183703 [Helobdella robusta]
MDVEEDLLIVDEVGVSSQQAGREQTSARPVFSDPERVYCRVADPGQERLRRSEGSGGYSYADAVRDRVLSFRNSKFKSFVFSLIHLFVYLAQFLCGPMNNLDKSNGKNSASVNY